MAPKKRNVNKGSPATESRKRGRDRDDVDDKASTGNKTKPTGVNKKKIISASSSLSLSGNYGQRLTAGGAAVLIAAIVAGILLNKQDAPQVDPALRSFWSVVCNSNSNNMNGASTTAAVCHKVVRPTRRTLEVSHRPILPGEILVEIPRTIQIWEHDALRSEVMTLSDRSSDSSTDDTKRLTLLDARHELSKNKLAGGAYLAAYLSWEKKRLIASSETSTSTTASPELDNFSSLRVAYFNALPTREELTYHPILANRTELKTLLGHHSWTYAVVVMMQEMVTSEYKALVNVSSEFGSAISRQDYEVARIHVLTRSFNPGPDVCQQEVSEKERVLWSGKLIETDSPTKESLFQYGCHSMIPILDALNHHPQPNVVYQYDSTKKAFTIRSKTKIAVGWELMDSYGKFSDSHLFARYGFVLGDGSGHTQASIAVFHRPLDVGLGSNEFTLIPVAAKKLDHLTVIPDFQKRDLKKYLKYDDGYLACVKKGSNPKAYELKRWKWKHLARIANDPDKWTITLGPRSPDSKPPKSSDHFIVTAPPKIDPRKNLRMDMSSVVATCRLLALTTDDYDGNALQVLKDNINNSTFVVDHGNESLEYRALMFLGRLASTALMQYQTSVQAEYDRVAELNQGELHSRKWTAAHLRLGEMQSLQALSGIAFGHARKWEHTAKTDTTGAFQIREKSCPSVHTDEIDKDEEQK